MEVRTGRLVDEQPPGLFVEHTDRFIVDDDDMDSVGGKKRFNCAHACISTVSLRTLFCATRANASALEE